MILLDFSSIAMSSIFPRIDDYDEDKLVIHDAAPINYEGVI